MSTDPLLKRVGGSVVYVGKPLTKIIGANHIDDWDLLMLVRYPSVKAFLGMVTSDEYRKVVRLREESLDRSVLQATSEFKLEAEGSSKPKRLVSKL